MKTINIFEDSYNKILLDADIWYKMKSMTLLLNRIESFDNGIDGFHKRITKIEMQSFLNISKNIISQGVDFIDKWDMMRSYKKKYIFNPYIAVVSDFNKLDVLDLFRDSQHFTIEKYNHISAMKWTTKHIHPNDSYNMYIMKQAMLDGSFIYKLGYSSNISKRVKSYEAHNPTIQLISCFYLEDGIKAEREIHQKYASIYRSEWYSSETMEQIIKDYNLKDIEL